MLDDLDAAAELVWENEGGRLRAAPPEGAFEGSRDGATSGERDGRDPRGHGRAVVESPRP
ncbi:hypothetical protein [Pseudonocardia sp.]|uniref:hypothetical protein n=1 Tax=Pseudonocardia sp. TaxID=60912 RepID=UPI003D132BB4